MKKFEMHKYSLQEREKSFWSIGQLCDHRLLFSVKTRTVS